MFLKAWPEETTTGLHPAGAGREQLPWSESPPSAAIGSGGPVSLSLLGHH